MLHSLGKLTIILTLLVFGSALSCASNQYYNNDISCINCPQNCTTCSNGQFCTSCKPNFYLVSNPFNVTCQTCSQIFIGCRTCLANVACTACNDGFFISNGVCSPCSTKNLFCAQCSSDGNNCTLCRFPFILANGLCVSGTISAITGGSVGSLGSTTTNSSSGSSTNNSNGTSNFIILPNGTRVAPVFDRNGCNQIQVFAQGRCLQAINFCISYQPNGLCQFCAQGYLVTIFGDCTVNNRMLACEAGFWLNRKQDVCVKVSPACDWYNPSNGACINCSRGYIWVNQSCVQSINCNSRQFFFEGVCIDVPAACAAFTTTGACTRCIQGYNLNGTTCTTDPTRILNGNTCNFPCRTCHEFNKGYCFSCVIFYQLQGARYGTCVPVVS